MPLISIADHDDLIKTRKSLYVSSIFTLIVANTVFVSKSLTLFGLKILVDQQDIIAVGRLSVGILLTTFLIQSLSNLLTAIGKIENIRFKMWDKKATSEIADIEMEMSNPAEFHRQPESEPWTEAYYAERLKRLARTSVLEKFSIGYNLFRITILDYMLVLVVSSSALLFPSSLSTIIGILR